MIFPDPNIGYVFGYKSNVTHDGILVTFLGGRVKILFGYKDIEKIKRETYQGGRISWDVIRWGRCPSGTEGIRLRLKKGYFRNHIIVFDNIKAAVDVLRSQGLNA